MVGLCWERGESQLFGKVLCAWGFSEFCSSPHNIQFLPYMWSEAPALPQQETCACYQCRVLAQKIRCPSPWDRVCSPLPPAAVVACTQAWTGSAAPLPSVSPLRLRLGEEKGPGGECVGLDACPPTCVGYFMPAKGPPSSLLS